METFIKGVATFLVTTVLGVVHFFYKPPAPPVVQPGNEPIPATSTLSSSFSSTSSVSTGAATTTTGGAVSTPINTGYPSTSGSASPVKPSASPSAIEMPVPTPSKVSYGVGTPTSSRVDLFPSTIPTGIQSNNSNISSPVRQVPYPTSSPTNPLDVIGGFLFPSVTTLVPTSTSVSVPTIVIPPPPMPASTGSAQPAQTSGGSTASTSTVLDSQIAALVGLPLSTPQRQEPLNTTGPEMYKVFDFAVSANSFTPNAIIVQQGDLAQLNITSSINTTLESKDLQFSVPIAIGSASAVSIPASNVGTFVFYATSSNSQPIFGYFVVRARI